MSTDHKAAKQAVELWHKQAGDYLTQATDGMEGVIRLLSDYAELPPLAGQVRGALEDAQTIMQALARLTRGMDGIAHLRGLQVASEALKDAPAAGAAGGEDQQ